MSEPISIKEMAKNIHDEVAMLWDGLEDKDDVEKALAILREVTDRHMAARRIDWQAHKDKT